MTGTPETKAPPQTARLAVEIAPVLLVLGFLFWNVRSVLSPLLAYAMLWALLWPRRREPLASRTLAATGGMVLVWFMWANGALLAPFLLSLAIAYLLDPIVEWLQERKVPRSLAIFLVLLPFLAVIVIAPILLIPVIQHQMIELARGIPAAAHRFADWALAQRTAFVERTGGLLTADQVAWLRNLQASDLVAAVTERWDGIASQAWQAFLGVGRGFSVMLTVIGYVVITPVVTFYLLKVWPRFTAKLGEAVPPGRREKTFAFAREYDRSLGRYIRGQLIEASFVAILTSTALTLLGFPGALLVGVLAGVFNVIPYVGLWISIVPGVLLALVSGAILVNLAKLAVVFAVVQFIDGSITGPRIVGDSVGLNPVWVILALALFGSMFGFVGLILAVPLAVLVKMLAAQAWQRYKSSEVYSA